MALFACWAQWPLGSTDTEEREFAGYWTDRQVIAVKYRIKLEVESSLSPTAQG